MGSIREWPKELDAFMEMALAPNAPVLLHTMVRHYLQIPFSTPTAFLMETIRMLVNENANLQEIVNRRVMFEMPPIRIEDAGGIVKMAVEQEREQCAQVTETARIEYCETSADMREMLAAKIRARGAVAEEKISPSEAAP